MVGERRQLLKPLLADVEGEAPQRLALPLPHVTLKGGSARRRLVWARAIKPAVSNQKAAYCIGR